MFEYLRRGPDIQGLDRVRSNPIQRSSRVYLRWKDPRAGTGGGDSCRTIGALQWTEAVAITETWTSDECAEAWGVKTSTWLGYVSRGQAPPPQTDHDERSRRLWDAEEVRRFPAAGGGSRARRSRPESEALLEEMREVAA
ncbi:MAG: hypothetical protein M3Z25_01070 [Actinomycetota bacterium]|nr:hypothetical protein [Actinomycetota bacterium]